MFCRLITACVEAGHIGRAYGFVVEPRHTRTAPTHQEFPAICIQPSRTKSALRAFEEIAIESANTLIEHDCVATAVSAFMIERGSWRGTATQLLHELTAGDRTEARVSQWASWPRNPSLFSNRPRAVAASLRKVKIEILFDKKMPDRRRTRIIELRKFEQEEHGFDAGATGVADGADNMDGVSSRRLEQSWRR